MVTNILMDLLKTDINQKQKDFEPTYSTKDTYSSFMKIFEAANKSNNFNNEKMKTFEPGKTEQNYLKEFTSQNEQFFQPDKEDLSFNYEQPFNNPEQEQSFNDNNTFSDKNSPVKQDKHYSETNSYQSNEEKNTISDNISRVEEKKPARQEQKEPVASAEDKSVEQNAGKHAEQAAAPVEKVSPEANKPDKPDEKQARQTVIKESTKDTAGKLMLEKANAREKQVEKPAEKEIKVEQKEIKEAKEVKVEQKVEQKEIKDNFDKKEVKVDVNNEKETGSTKKNPVTTENNQEKPKEVKTEQNASKQVEQKVDKEVKAEIAKEPEVKEKTDKEEPQTRELANNKEKNEDSKAALPPNTKQLDIKEDLKVENIKIIANAEAQKIAASESMDKQNRQDPGRETKTNLNQIASADGNTRNVDLQKAAQFDKILNSKQAETTQRSVINQVKNASAQLGANKSEVSINLRPDNLGKVNINLVTQKGELTAQITVENNQARDMLAKGLDSLKQGLSEQGVNVNRVVVNVQDSSSSKGENDFDGTNKFDENGNSSETNTGSDKEDNLEENDQAPNEMESYDFEEETGDPDKPKMRNLVGNIDYKV